MHLHVFVIICLILLVTHTYAKSIDEMIYTSVSFSYGCYRVLDQDGFYGCSSRTRSGDVGTLLLVNSTSDLSLISKQDRDIIAVVPSHMFESTTLNALNTSQHVVGVVTLSTKELDGNFDPPDYFNAEVSTPQSKLTPDHHDHEYVWNPQGTGEIHRLFNWPMVSISGQEGDKVFQSALANNLRYEKNEFLTYRGKMAYYNSAFRNSRYCLSDRTCLPIGGYSVISMFGVPEFHGTNLPYILVPVPKDGRALFHRQTISAVHTQSGVIVAMVAARTLAKYYNAKIGQTTPPKRIVFALLAGEDWSRVGSRSLLNDILLSTPPPDPNPDDGGNDDEIAPMYPCDVDRKGSSYPPFARNATDTTIACDRPYKVNTSIYQTLQMKNLDSIFQMHSPVSKELYIHTEKPPNQKTQEMVDLIIELAGEIEILNTKNVISVQKASASTPGIPPSSTQTFVAHDKDIPSTFLSSFNEEFNNPYQSTSFDDMSMLGDDKGYNLLCAYTTLMTRTLLVLSGSAPKTPVDGSGDLDINTVHADCQQVIDLINCFNADLQCPLFGQLFSFGASKRNPMSFSASTYRPAPSGAITNYGRLLYNWFYRAGYDAVVNSNPIDNNDDDNDNDNNNNHSNNNNDDKENNNDHNNTLHIDPDEVYDDSIHHPIPTSISSGENADHITGNTVADSDADILNIIRYTRFAYFHDALDPYVKLNYETNLFEIDTSSAPDQTKIPPIYTESNWDSDTFITIYQTVNPSVMVIYGGVAASIFVLFCIIAWCMFIRLKKRYAFRRLDKYD